MMTQPSNPHVTITRSPTVHNQCSVKIHTAEATAFILPDNAREPVIYEPSKQLKIAGHAIIRASFVQAAQRIPHCDPVALAAHCYNNEASITSLGQLRTAAEALSDAPDIVRLGHQTLTENAYSIGVQSCLISDRYQQLTAPTARTIADGVRTNQQFRRLPNDGHITSLEVEISANHHNRALPPLGHLAVSICVESETAQLLFNATHAPDEPPAHSTAGIMHQIYHTMQQLTAQPS